MIGLLKTLRGYVRIKVWGFSPERFINLCSNKNILLWDIRREGDIYYMCVSLEGFRRLPGIARKTKTRVVILQRYGLPFLIPGLLARKVFIFGFLAAAFFWFFTSLFVWKIDLAGNEIITDDVFYSFLAQEGVHVGMRSRDVDIGQLEKDIRRNFPEIIWTSAKFSGTSLIISVKENDASSALPKEEGYADLYADMDGVIVEMIVRSGVPQVQIGDTVKMGDLLVSGRIPLYSDDASVKGYQYTRADADICVERTRQVYETLPFDHIQKVYTGREEKQYYIEVGGKEFGFGKSSGFLYYDLVDEAGRVSVLEGLSLPFWYGVRIIREYQNVECTYSLEEARMLLGEKYERYMEGLEQKGVQIITKNVTIDTSRNRIWILQGELTVRERIGADVPFDIR